MQGIKYVTELGDAKIVEDIVSDGRISREGERPVNDRVHLMPGFLGHTLPHVVCLFILSCRISLMGVWNRSETRVNLRDRFLPNKDLLHLLELGRDVDLLRA
jgi:hypothetical protein